MQRHVQRQELNDERSIGAVSTTGQPNGRPLFLTLAPFATKYTSGILDTRPSSQYGRSAAGRHSKTKGAQVQFTLVLCNTIEIWIFRGTGSLDNSKAARLCHHKIMSNVGGTYAAIRITPFAWIGFPNFS